MSKLNVDKVSKALQNSLRRDILKAVSDKPRTVSQIAKDLGGRGPIYRQSVNRALEILRESGLVKKEYDIKKKGLYFSITTLYLSIDLKNMSISSTEEF